MTSTLRQLSRYAVVGLVANLAAFIAYLGLTAAGLAPALAMSLVYVSVVCTTFLFNKRWSFADRQPGGGQIARYWVAYGAGYLVNLGWLTLFHGVMGFRHDLVQASAIIVVAVLLFVLQKFWVFRGPASLRSRLGA